jgi:hypothetical protein
MSVLPFDLPDKAIQTNKFIFLTGTEDFTIRKLLRQRLPEHAVSVSLFTSARDMVLVNITQAAWLVLNARNNGTGITVSISRIQKSNLLALPIQLQRYFSKVLGCE